MAAIYMWRETGYVVVVTTPYPIEITEKLAPSGDVVEGSLATIPESYGQSDKTFNEITYVQTRWFIEDGPYESYGQSDKNFNEITYVQTRWFLEDGPYESYGQPDKNFVEITYVLKLVYADSEVESLDLSGDVRPTSTMDAV